MKLKRVLMALSDTELTSISKELTSDIDTEYIHQQLIGKSDDGEVTFTQKQITNGIINELTRRVLDRDAKLGEIRKES